MKKLVSVLQQKDVQIALSNWVEGNTPDVNSYFSGVVKMLLPDEQLSLESYLTILKKIIKKFNSHFIATDRLALEQSSHHAISSYKSTQYPQGIMLDLCCGVGGDSLFCKNEVIGIDVNKDRLVAYEYNHQLLRPNFPTKTLCEDVSLTQHKADFFIIDPDRRHEDKTKNWGTDQLSPSINELHSLVEKYQSAWIKLGPATDTHLFSFPHNKEYIGFPKSVNELSVKTGHFFEVEGLVKTTQLEPYHQEIHLEDDIKLAAQKLLFNNTPKNFVYEPSSLALASSFHLKLAADNKLNTLHPSIPYYTSDKEVDHPFLYKFQTIEELKFRDKKIQAFIASGEWSEIEVKKRGVNCSPNELQLKWKKKVSFKKEAPTLTLFLYPDSKNKEKIKVLACTRL